MVTLGTVAMPLISPLMPVPQFYSLNRVEIIVGVMFLFTVISNWAHQVNPSCSKLKLISFIVFRVYKFNINSTCINPVSIIQLSFSQEEKFSHQPT